MPLFPPQRVIDSRATGVSCVVDLELPEAEWAGRYDRVRVERSLEGEGSLFEALTGPVYRGAQLANVPAQTFPGMAPLVGKTLRVQVNEDLVTETTFTGVDPLGLSAIAAQITAAAAGAFVATVVPNTLYDGPDFLRLDGAALGSRGSLRMLASDAAAVLGFDTAEPGSLAFGLEPHPTLLPGQTHYELVDHQGKTGAVYRASYWNSVTDDASEWSTLYVPAVPGRLVESELVRVTFDLVDGFGRPQALQGILIEIPQQYLTRAGRNVVPTRERIVTDAAGHAECRVVRGARVRVSVTGTSLVRDLTAPTDPAVTSFDAFDPAHGTDDAFRVQVPEVDYAVRRS